MGKKEQSDDFNKSYQRVESVLHLLRKQASLSMKQEKFCNKSCVERFLKAKGENVKKAAKQLRVCLSWRENLGVDSLMADEFSAELADGVAYVAGHDDESRPVLIFRIKQDYQKFHSQKLFVRLLVFTLEVAISTVSKNVEQLVLIFDASFFRSASAFMNLFVAALKVISEYYPGRLHKAFVIDPPSLFSYIWKGVRPFVELSTLTMVVSSVDYQDALDYNDFSSYPSRASSLRFDTSSIKSTARIGACASSRFAFSVSQHSSSDSLKPWHLSLTDTSSSSKRNAQISPLTARSFSFASPADRSEPRGSRRRSLFGSTPMPVRQPMGTSVRHPRTPGPGFFQSPAVFFRRECHVSRSERSRESFVPFLKLYRRPYDEMTYRSKMRPPLGGLISIVSPQIRRRHVSLSQRF